MMQGKLIVFEGIDGSGKSTQYKLLCSRLEREGHSFSRLVFPRYNEPSGALAKAYLNGEFGSEPGDVNPYAASSFYAVDRLASYLSEWKPDYESGAVFLADRYTTSNAVHQGSKLRGEEREKYFDWLYDFEYRLLKLPAPNLVIYMDIDAETAISQMQRRQEELAVPGDIHERDAQYLKECAASGAEAARKYGWVRVGCLLNGEMRGIEDIHKEIYSIVRAYI